MKSSKLKLRLSVLLPIGVSLLTGCGSTPAPVETTTAAPVQQSAPVSKAPTPEALAEPLTLEPAEVTYQAVTTADEAVAQDADEQLQRELLQQAKAALSTDPKRTLAICFELQQSLYSQIRAQNQLPLLQSALADKQHALVARLADQTAFTDVPEADRQAWALALSEYFQQQDDNVSATRTLLALDAWLGNSADSTAQDLLWQQLVKLSDAELRELGEQNHPRAQAWLELLQLTQGFAGDQQAITQALTDWQQRHPMLPAADKLPKDVKLLSQTPAYNPERIAVLLPLSGPLKTLGDAVQYGMAAAAAKQQRTLVFIDSTKPAAELQAEVTAAQVQFVIGPLLREDIDKIQQLPDWQWPTLFLNGKGDLPVKPEQYFFALAWEDEASQMVQVFRQRQYQHPVLIYAVNPIGQRMAQHFQSRWQQSGGQPVETYSYSSQEQLQALINKFLEAEASEERAKEINRLIGQSIKAELHSRQDIDAIYLIADPVQTRFFKPFIDVTVSPTAKRLPIFTSSRSHSLKVDKTDQRDLAGLTMTEMPWLLPQAAIAPPLRQEFDSLFAEQDEQLQRLFAMGHDALMLVGHLKQQQQFPAMAYHGLTGSLRLADGHSIQRQLTLAQYRQGKLLLVDKKAP
ncbi:penicillin-binding protein activator [Rheinheimera tilapiae]|uniref:Penicillin-binding protein activator n=1 Tax=Rheinheimera tilapiae TaxID=875043 RepID=A0ABV6B967_9GAMM